MKLNQNNVKYIILNFELIKFFPLQFFNLRHTLFAPRDIRTNCRPILWICNNLKSMYYFQHETKTKQCEIHVFIFRIKQFYPTMCSDP